MDITEKLKMIQSLVAECLDAQGGEEEEEMMEEPASESSQEAGDKIKFAANLLKKRMS